VTESTGAAEATVETPEAAAGKPSAEGLAAEKASAEGPAPFEMTDDLRAELAEIRRDQRKQRRMLFDIKDTMDNRLRDPMLRDFILLIDRIGLLRQDVERYAGDPQYARRSDLLRAFGWAKRRILDGLEAECMDILARAGVVRIQHNDDRFDPREQRAVKVVAVDEPDKDGRALEILRSGYRFENGQLLRAQDVVVGRFSPEGKGGKECLGS